MKRILIFAFLLFGVAVAANATVNDGRVVTTVGYVTHEMGTLQNEIPSQTGTKAMTFGDDAGEIGARDVVSTLGTSTSDTSLPMVSAVNDKLDDKQNTLPAKNTNTVLTYTGVEGSVGEKGIYQNSGSYAGQMDNLVTAGTFNAALKNGLDNEFVCAETNPATGQCWAYMINNGNTDTVRNLFNKNDLTRINAYFPSSGSAWTYTSAGYSIRIPCSPNTTYTARYNGNSTQAVLSFASTASDNIPTSSMTTVACTNSVRQTSPTINTPITITTGADDKWLIVQYNVAEPQNTDMANNLQIEVGSSASAYSNHIDTILPDGYTPLEYIESTGTQYIDTGVKSSSDSKTYVEFIPTAWAGAVFGNYADNNQVSNSNTLYIGQQTASYVYATDSGHNEGSALDRTKLGNISLNTKYTVLVDWKNREAVFDNTTRIQLTNTTSWQGTNNQVLFARTNGTSVGYFGKLKMFVCKIYNNNVLVRDFIPAQHGNVIGLYDTVTNTFFTNAGTGTFIAGPVANNNLYIPQNQ